MALQNLSAGGGTAGAEGIRQAYQLAEMNFDKNSVNRVILGTDGDFNVGITNQGELKDFVEREKDKGIFLSVLGFGRGNYNDAMMQTLAQNGNGTAAYIDSLSEARKVLVEEATKTLFPIAKDVKIQVEFNPATVAEYRLVGYETRALKTEDFNNDKVDAGEQQNEYGNDRQNVDISLIAIRRKLILEVRSQVNVGQRLKGKTGEIIALPKFLACYVLIGIGLPFLLQGLNTGIGP